MESLRDILIHGKDLFDAFLHIILDGEAEVPGLGMPLLREKGMKLILPFMVDIIYRQGMRLDAEQGQDMTIFFIGYVLCH